MGSADVPDNDPLPVFNLINLYRNGINRVLYQSDFIHFDRLGQQITRFLTLYNTLSITYNQLKFGADKSGDVNLGGWAGIGLMPTKGLSASYVNYGAKASIDFGFKRVKLANTAELVTRTGKQEIDYDVYRASNTNTTSTSNRMGTGNFKYNVLRIGTGLKIDTGDEYAASHYLLQLFAEKPSFYPTAITESPIFSYQFEWMSKSNLAMLISYSKNYVIAGEKKYYIPEPKNSDYFHFQIGKYWTILK